MRRAGRWAAALALLALCAVGVLAGPAAAAPTSGPPLVVLGVPELRWNDVTASGTPAIWALATRGATGALVVRGVDERTPPLDGWATLSAGNRARGGLTTEQERRRNAGTLTGAKVGALGSALQGAGQCAAPSGGAGARLAASNHAGQPTAAPGQACRVLITEIDGLRAAADRGAALARIDRAVAAAVRDLPTGATVLLLGVSDAPLGDAAVHVAIVDGPGYPAGSQLRSASTRRAPFVQLIDIAPTLLDRLGVARPDSMIGQPIEAVGPHRSVGAARSHFLDADRHARQMHRAVPLFFVPLVAAFVLGLAAAVGLLAAGRRRAGRRLARITAYAVAPAPVGALLADLLPWWRGPVGLIWPAALAGAGVALAVAALLARASGRRTGVGVLVWLCAVTLTVVALDLVTGAHLQLSSVPGYDPLIAGRFAGIGNPGFGILAAATLLTAALLAPSWPVAAAVGLVGVVVDGAPAFGSDVGGVLALVPGVVLVVLAAAGRRPSWRAVALGIGGAAVAIVGFAALDLARPADSRTHLGRFASDLLHGSAGGTVHRKLVANWDLLTSNAATVLVPFILVGLAVVVLRAGRLRGTAGLAAAYEACPMLRTALLACLLTGVLGLLLNDSGVVVPAMMLLLAVPVAVLAATAPLSAVRSGR